MIYDRTGKLSEAYRSYWLWPSTKDKSIKAEWKDDKMFESTWKDFKKDKIPRQGSGRLWQKGFFKYYKEKSMVQPKPKLEISKGYLGKR